MYSVAGVLFIPSGVFSAGHQSVLYFNGILQNLDLTSRAGKHYEDVTSLFNKIVKCHFSLYLLTFLKISTFLYIMSFIRPWGFPPKVQSIYMELEQTQKLNWEFIVQALS